MMRNVLRYALATGLAVVFLFLAGAGSAPVRGQAADAVVSVEGGKLAGAPSPLGDEVMVYRGVPFAAPPVGDLRWRPPQPAPGWDGVRDATEAGPACMQRAIPGEAGRFYDPGVDRMSEDCLYLNVWTAAGPEDRAPVLVWIYGGGLRIGNGADVTYDGTRLAQRGVLLVTINYRLGAFGYLAHPAAERRVRARRVRQLRHPRSGRRARLDPAEHRGVRGRPVPRRDLRRVGRLVERQPPDGDAAGARSLPCRDRRERGRLRIAGAGRAQGGDRVGGRAVGRGAAGRRRDALARSDAGRERGRGAGRGAGSRPVDGKRRRLGVPRHRLQPLRRGRAARRAGHRRLERRRDVDPRRRGRGRDPGAAPRVDPQRVRRARRRVLRDLPGRDRRGGAAGAHGERYRRHVRLGDADVGPHDADGLVARVSLLLQPHPARRGRRPLRRLPHGRDRLRVRQLRGQSPPVRQPGLHRHGPEALRHPGLVLGQHGRYRQPELGRAAAMAGL